MHRWVVPVVVIGLVCSGTVIALTGSGTEGDPWRITSLADFDEFAGDPNYWDDYTRLETDVNLAGIVYERAVIAWDVNSANAEFDGIAFTGVFDGNDHKIMNLIIDDSGAGNDYLGLFGYIDDREVSNLSIEGGSVNGDDQLGGLVGVIYGGNLTNCYSTVNVNGSLFVGGLVGVNLSNISNCYSTGDVIGVQYVGGLAGATYDSITNCYSTGDVSGVSCVGGFLGLNISSVSNCYSISDVNGVENVGGLVGLNTYFRQVSNCFWDKDTQTHGVTYGIGYNDSGIVTNVLGLTTAQMQIRSTFTDADWDFINTWNIGENQTYPYLRTVSPGDINKDHITNFFDLGIICNQWLKEP